MAGRRTLTLNVALVELLGRRHGDVPLGLERAEDLSVCLIDSTCLEANTHFPVDWVFLKDVALIPTHHFIWY